MLSNFTKYVKQIWKNKPDTSSPLNATRLNHIEDGIENNSNAISELDTSVTELTEKSLKRIGTASSGNRIWMELKGADGTYAIAITNSQLVQLQRLGKMYKNRKETYE